MWISVVPTPFVEKMIHSSLIHFAHWPKMHCPKMYGFISELLVLPHWSIYLLLCQHHITGYSQCCAVLKLGSMCSPILFFFFQDYFGSLESLEISDGFWDQLFHFWKKGSWEFGRDCTESVDWLRESSR